MINNFPKIKDSMCAFYDAPECLRIYSFADLLSLKEITSDFEPTWLNQAKKHEKSLYNIIIGEIQSPCKDVIRGDLIKCMKYYDETLYDMLKKASKNLDKFYRFNIANVSESELKLAISFYRTAFTSYVAENYTCLNTAKHNLAKQELWWNKCTLFWANSFIERLKRIEEKVSPKWYVYEGLIISLAKQAKRKVNEMTD